jgi:hypothetical protein
MCGQTQAVAASGDGWQVLLLLPLLGLAQMRWAWAAVTKGPSLALWRTGALVSLTGWVDSVKLGQTWSKCV